MSQHVTVAFGGAREYQFAVADADVAGMAKDEARAWFAGEFENLECTPSNPMGKVLLMDMILNVAKYGGEQRFSEGGEWARRFAAATAVALQRPTVRVDVANYSVG